MTGPILVAVDDLIFLSKIQQTARLLGVSTETVEPAKLRERVSQSPVAGILLDLNHRSGQILDALRTLKTDSRTEGLPTLGFISHVQTDLAAQARVAGCDRVLARSTFSAQLPQILQEWVRASGGTTP